MRRELTIHRFFIKLLKKIGIVKETEIDKSVMCRRAVESGVCSNCCEKCAWSERLGECNEQNRN